MRMPPLFQHLPRMAGSDEYLFMIFRPKETWSGGGTSPRAERPSSTSSSVRPPAKSSDSAKVCPLPPVAFPLIKPQAAPRQKLIQDSPGRVTATSPQSGVDTKREESSRSSAMEVSIARPIPHPRPDPATVAVAANATFPRLTSHPALSSVSFPPKDSKGCRTDENPLFSNLGAVMSHSMAYKHFMALGHQGWRWDTAGYVPLAPTLHPYWRQMSSLPLYLGENLHSHGQSFPYGPLPTPSKKLYACPECRYITDRKNNLKRHVGTMHKDCERVLECCGIFFKTKASLRDHVLIFHSNGYMCGHCGRNFCRKALLKRHMTVHSGQKDFVCPQCGYSTSHKSNLERHKKVHDREMTEDGEHPQMSPNVMHEDSRRDIDGAESCSDISGDTEDLCDEIDVVTG